MAAASVLRRHRDLAVDTSIGVSLFALFAASIAAFSDVLVPAPWQSWMGLVAGAVLTLPLALRRRTPLAVLSVVAAGLVAFRLLGGCCEVVTTFAMMLAVYSAGAYGRPARRDIVRGIAVVGALGVIAWTIVNVPHDPGLPDLRLLNVVVGLVPAFVLFAAGWILGDQVRLRRDNEDRLRQRTAELEIERDVNGERAAIAERLRIAREIHDALGHHVSMMGVQAAGAERALERDPDAAVSALRAVQESSRRAVTELQQALRLLRDHGDGEGRSPARLSRLDDLAREVRRAGVEVTIQAETPPHDLPESVDLAATRVVQEALTNVLRHAGPGSSAWVRARIRDGAVHIDVEDDGRGRPHAAAASAGSRHGLKGLRERVELHGGRLFAGKRPDGGFRVSAAIPLTREPAFAEEGLER